MPTLAAGFATMRREPRSARAGGVRSRPAPLRIDNHRPRVLVVEDEPAIGRLIARVVQELDCEVAVVGSAEEAIERLQRQGADLAIVDVRLPGMDGLELSRRIHEEDLPHPPVLLTSAYGRPRVIHAEGWLAKPFDIDDLSDMVRALLEDRATS